MRTTSVNGILSGVATSLAVFLCAAPKPAGAADKAFGTPVVVDSQGKVIGALEDYFGLTAFEIAPGVVVDAYLKTYGFLKVKNYAVTLLFTSGDCSGQAYLEKSSTDLISSAMADDAVVYYRSGPNTTETIRSSRASTSASPCQSVSRVVRVQPAQSKTLGSLGLVPPFHVEQQ